MINNQLVEYVKSQFAIGSTQEKIRSDLIHSGNWGHADVDEAFAVIGATPVPVSSDVPVALVKYAGFWIRWVALMVDSLVLTIPLVVMQFILLGMEVFSSDPSLSQQVLSSLVGFAVSWTYFVMMTYTKGATLGKMMVGIQVVSANSDKLSLGKVLLRETLGRILSTITIFIGYLSVVFTKRKQGLHDKIAQSVVVYKNPNAPLGAGVWVAIVLAGFLPALAILGILASVILASLSSARNKGFDAAIKSQLTSLRAQSEFHYLNNDDSYLPANDCFSGMFLEPGHASLVSEIQSKDFTCRAYADSYAISAQLSDPEQYFCVDSTAHAGDGTVVDDGTRTYCKALEEDTGDKDAKHNMTTSTYSVDFPTDWQIAQKSDDISSVVNQSLKSTLVVSRVELSEADRNIVSIFDAADERVIESSLKTEFPNAIIQSINRGSIDGVGAYVSTFNSGKITDREGGSRHLSIVQYNLVRNGSAYTIILMSDIASEQGPLAFDRGTIMESFRFLGE